MERRGKKIKQHLFVENMTSLRYDSRSALALALFSVRPAFIQENKRFSDRVLNIHRELQPD